MRDQRAPGPPPPVPAPPSRPPLARLRRLRARWIDELHGRSLAQAARDLRRLSAEGGASAVAQRLGYSLHRLPAPGSGPTLNPRVHAHAWGSAHSPVFDLTPAELAANRAVVERFDDRPPEVRSATWFLTYFEHALFGGVYTILRLMSWMKQVHGVEHRLVVFDRQNATDAEIRSAISLAFPNLADVDVVLPVDGRLAYDELPPTDIAVCTLWTSAYVLARFNATRAKFYMVQDYEPLFYAAGTVSALSEATYRLGFAGIVNTPGLAESYASYGNPYVSFVPGADLADAARPKPSVLPGAPVQVVIYGRPSTDRNAFELIAAACKQIKQRYGPRVRIVSAGEDWQPAEFLLDGVLENRGLLRSLDDVRALYSESDIGICFMLSKHPSYQPFEYLSAHVAPVCNVNPATSWLLRHEENCLITEPFPSNVCAAVSRLVDDVELRDKIVAAGHEQVVGVDWEAQLDRIWRFVTGDGRWYNLA